MTLKELSERSGVSIATISRIMNNRAGVSKENIEKVSRAVQRAGDEKLMKKLEAARSERRVIAVVVPDLSNPFFTAVIRGISAVLEKQNCNIIVCDTQESNLRELENVLEGAAAMSDSDIIYPEHVHLKTEPMAQTLRQHMREEERRFIQQTLAQCGGNRQQAMKQLDISRSVFYERLKEYGLH